MRILIATFAIVLATTQIASAQVAPVAPGGPLQGMPTLAPLVKSVTPGVVNIAIRGRIAQERNPLSNDPFAASSTFLKFPPSVRYAPPGRASSSMRAKVSSSPITTWWSTPTRSPSPSRLASDCALNRSAADPDTDVAVIRVDSSA